MKNIVLVLFITVLVSSCKETPEIMVLNKYILTATEAQFSKTDSTLHYEIDLVYPVIDANVAPEILTHINNVITDQFYIFSDQQNFIESHLNLPENFYKDDNEWYGTLQNNYRISQCDSIINIGFTIFGYYLGAAHGYTNNYSLQFNIQTGEQLNYTDFFKTNDSSIAKARQIINTSLDTLCWGIEHDSATIQVLSNFTISNDSVSFRLSDYELCPYAYGITYISFPKSDFESILTSPNFNFCTEIDVVQDEGEIASH
jgi:hypothetical protein